MAVTHCPQHRMNLRAAPRRNSLRTLPRSPAAAPIRVLSVISRVKRPRNEILLNDFLIGMMLLVSLDLMFNLPVQRGWMSSVKLQ